AGRIFGTVYLLYVPRGLGFRPGVLGMTFAVGGVTSLAGALLARQTAQRLGLGPTMILGLIFTGLGSLLSPLAHGATTVALLLLVGNQLVTDPGYAVYEINAISLRQAITPDRLLGR